MSQINSDGGDAGGGPTTVEIHRSHGGGCFGQLQVLTDEPSFFTVKVVKPEAPHRETVVAKLEADFIRSHQQRDCFSLLLMNESHCMPRKQKQGPVFGLRLRRDP